MNSGERLSNQMEFVESELYENFIASAESPNSCMQNEEQTLCLQSDIFSRVDYTNLFSSVQNKDKEVESEMEEKFTSAQVDSQSWGGSCSGETSGGGIMREMLLTEKDFLRADDDVSSGNHSFFSEVANMLKNEELFSGNLRNGDGAMECAASATQDVCDMEQSSPSAACDGEYDNEDEVPDVDTMDESESSAVIIQNNDAEKKKKEKREKNQQYRTMMKDKMKTLEDQHFKLVQSNLIVKWWLKTLCEKLQDCRCIDPNELCDILKKATEFYAPNHIDYVVSPITSKTRKRERGKKFSPEELKKKKNERDRIYRKNRNKKRETLEKGNDFFTDQNERVFKFGIEIYNLKCTCGK